MDFNLVAAKNQLEALGHEVVTESNADKAIQKLTSTRYRSRDFDGDIVMTDLYFGTTAAGLAIILMCIAKEIPVVMLTDADGHKDKLVTMLEEGINIKNVSLQFATSQYGVGGATLCAGFTEEGQLIKDWATALEYSQL